MILICVGASENKFDRLLMTIDELCDEGILSGDKIIAQIGFTDYEPRNYKSFSLIGRDDFQKYIEQSELIITHAGTGSVVPLLKLGKKVIIFPRLKQYKEHIDDHQLEISEFFTNEGYALSAKNIDELRIAVKQAETFRPKTFISNNSKINNLIIDFIEKI